MNGLESLSIDPNVIQQSQNVPKEYITRGKHPQISFIIDKNAEVSEINSILDLIRDIQKEPQNVTLGGRKARFEFETLIKHFHYQKLDTREIQNLFMSDTDICIPRGILVLSLKDNYAHNFDAKTVLKELGNFIRTYD